MSKKLALVGMTALLSGVLIVSACSKKPKPGLANPAGASTQVGKPPVPAPSGQKPTPKPNPAVGQPTASTYYVTGSVVSATRVFYYNLSYSQEIQNTLITTPNWFTGGQDQLATSVSSTCMASVGVTYTYQDGTTSFQYVVEFQNQACPTSGLNAESAIKFAQPEKASTTATGQYDIYSQDGTTIYGTESSGSKNLLGLCDISNSFDYSDACTLYYAPSNVWQFFDSIGPSIN